MNFPPSIRTTPSSASATDGNSYPTGNKHSLNYYTGTHPSPSRTG